MIINIINKGYCNSFVNLHRKINKSLRYSNEKLTLHNINVNVDNNNRNVNKFVMNNSQNKQKEIKNHSNSDK